MRERKKEPYYLPYLWSQLLLGLAPYLLSPGLDFLLLLQSWDIFDSSILPIKFHFSLSSFELNFLLVWPSGPHFTEEETKAQGDVTICSGPHIAQSWG